MSETIRIAEELRLAFDGEAWHGPALLEILEDVNAATAAGHPIPNKHSIWELVLHIAAWEKILIRRIGGEAFMPRDEENFPPVLDQTEGAWAEAQAHLKKAHEDLMQTVRKMPEAKLNQVVPGKNYDFYFMLHGGSQHIAYHGGQISLLKKMSGA